MTERLRSLRVWLVVAMLTTAVVTILVGNFVIDRLNASSEWTADRAKGLITARAIATRVREGAGTRELQALQQALPNDQIVVIRNGAVLFSGPPKASLPLEVTVSTPIPGGKVILRDHHAPGTGGWVQVSLVAGVIAVLVIAEAWIGATLLMRTVRRPLARATETADRLAGGDFSARMGASGPEEFDRLSRALDSMAAQLQRTDSEQRRFLADLAHEISTPVSALSGFACALADGSAQTSTERAEAADIVVHESHRLQRLLADVRQLNRLELAESVGHEQVGIRDLCVETARRFRLAAQQGHVGVRVHAGPVTVTADPRLVEAVINNFVSNAIRYTPPDGQVVIRARRSRSAVVISVRDTGIGIAPEHLERVFDRLYRVDEARDRASGGSGLGLAIARRAARSLGARIEVESAPREGSEFRLVLQPVSVPSPMQVPAPPYPGPSAATARRPPP